MPVGKQRFLPAPPGKRPPLPEARGSRGVTLSPGVRVRERAGERTGLREER